MSLFKSLRGILPGNAVDKSGPVAAADAMASSPPEPAATDRNAAPGPESAPPARRVLFVERERALLHELSRELEGMRRHWDMTFTASGTAALEAMAQTPFHAVVAGLELSDRSGVAFLNEVGRRFPHTLRFVHCSPAERKAIKDFHGVAPQHLSTELDAEGITQAVRRAFRLDEWMANTSTKALLAQLQKLPTLPTLYTQVIQELQSPSMSLEVVANIIAKDPVMTAKMLQVVNSAYFSLPREIVEPVEAVMFLGTERTKSLILMAKVFSQFDQTRCENFDVNALWRHSMEVGSYARAVTMAETKETRLADLAFTAGLLHDIGKLLLAANLPDMYSRVLDQAKRRNLPVRDIEFDAFGTTHCEIAACLLGTWGLPLGILEAVACHNKPSLSEDDAFSTLTAVHVANAIDHEKAAEKADILVSRMETTYFERIGLAGKRNRWRELLGAPVKAQEEAKARTVK